MESSLNAIKHNIDTTISLYEKEEKENTIVFSRDSCKKDQERGNVELAGAVLPHWWYQTPLCNTDCKLRLGPVSEEEEEEESTVMVVSWDGSVSGGQF